MQTISSEIPVELYHCHHQKFDEDIPFWKALSKTYSPDILEIGCGTGRVIKHLDQTKNDVIGFDLDFQRLAYTRKNDSINRSTSLFQADAETFRLGRNFDLILMPCNTFSTMPPEVRNSVLRQVKQHLKHMGIFVASIPNPHSLNFLEVVGSETEFEEEFLHPEDGNPVQVSSSINQSPGILEITWHYDHLFPDGSVKRYSTQVAHYLDSQDVMLSEFENSGLRLIKQYGDFDKSLYDDRSPYWIFELEYP